MQNSNLPASLNSSWFQMGAVVGFFLRSLISLQKESAECDSVATTSMRQRWVMNLRGTLGALLMVGLGQLGCSGDDRSGSDERGQNFDESSADDGEDGDEGGDGNGDDTDGSAEETDGTPADEDEGPAPCDCEPGNHCDASGACVPGCVMASDCADGQLCHDDGTCIDEGSCPDTLVPALTISAISINQAVEIPLYAGGEEVAASERPARVVQNRGALFRVSVTPEAGYVPTEVTTRLTLDNGGVVTELETQGMINEGSDESTLTGTSNILVEAAHITDSTKFSVALYQTRCAEGGTAVYPGQGLAELGAERTGRVKVVLVPYERAPFKLNVSEEMLEAVKDGLYAYYPTEGVDLEVHEPVVVTQPSTDLPRVLQHISSLRAEDNPDDDTYYYGMFTAAETMRDFCGDGCIAGIATLGGRGAYGEPSERYGVGIGYLSDVMTTSQGHPMTEKAITINVMAHELGHSQGRQHAPCGGAAGTDRNFPNDTAAIDTYGYNLVSGGFATPAAHTDLMGYCEPQWVSPYTYDAIATRIRGVSDSSQRVLGGKVTPFASLLLRQDGEASWGEVRKLRGRPAGDIVTARAYDASGRLVDANVQVTVSELSDDQGKLLTLPVPESSWASLEVAGQRVAVRVAEPL
jgi:hypothetical protein